MRYLLFLTLTLALLMPGFAAAQTAPQAKVDTYGLRIDGRTVELLFRVTDRASGRDLQGLAASDLTILEDGQPIAASLKLQEEQTDAVNPQRSIELPPLPSGASPVPGSRPVDLHVVGATIGIVFDASKLINQARDPVDYLARGRQLIIDLLEAGRPIAPNNPEQLGLFLPMSVPAVAGEQLRPEGLPDFGQDRNAVINALNQLQPRNGKTNLFDTINVAIAATADAAAQRGAEAYLLIVTDGGDAASAGSFDALLAEAAARQVTLLVLGIGPEQRLATNAATLTTLANRTGGAYLGNPTSEAIAGFYQEHVQVVGQSAYMLRYETALIDDGEEHYLTLRVDGPAGGESEPVPLFVELGSTTDSVQIGTALGNYAIRAIPLAIIISLLLTALLIFLGRMGRGASSSLSGGITRT